MQYFVIRKKIGIHFGKYNISYLVMFIVFSVASDSLWPHGLEPSRLFCPWNFPGKNIGVGNHFLFPGIFPTQGLNSHLLHLLQWQVFSLPLQHLWLYLAIYINTCYFLEKQQPQQPPLNKNSSFPEHLGARIHTHTHTPNTTHPPHTHTTYITHTTTLTHHTHTSHTWVYTHHTHHPHHTHTHTHTHTLCPY